MGKHTEASATSAASAHESGSHATPLSLLYCDSDLAVGGGGDIFVVLWRDRTTLDGVAQTERVYRRISRNRGCDLALITIVECGAKAPDMEAREALAQLMRAASNHVAISAIVYEETGFLAAAFRGVVTGLSMVARHTFTHRMWKDLPSAAAWIEGEQSRIGIHFSKAELVDAVAQFRELVNPPMKRQANG
jgi:hypothetical protein